MSDGGLPRASTIVVHWQGEEDLARLVAAWPEDPRWELVVVDNGSRRLPPLPAAARLVRPGRNLGFAGGAAAGVAAARGEAILLLNPDARPRPGALQALLAGLEAHPEAAGLAPRLLGKDGEPQHRWQLRPLPRPWQLVAHAFFVDPVRGPRHEPAAGSRVEQPAAAALLLRRAAWERVGGMDTAFFPAWFEDVDLARRLARAGERLLYWPAAVFDHGRGASVAPLGYRGFLLAYYGNLRRYLGKHHGRGWEGVARLALMAGMTARLLLLPLRRPARAATRGEAAGALLATARAALVALPEGPA